MYNMYKSCVFIVILIQLIVSYAQKDISVEKIYKNRVFNSKSVIQFKVLKDGEHFVHLTESQYLTKHKITEHDSTGDTILNLNNLVIEGQKLQIDNLSFSPDETKLLITTNIQYVYRHSFTATYYVYEFAQKTLRPLNTIYERQSLATFSPDGNYIAYVVDNNLFLSNLKTQEIKQITTDGYKNKIINGATDWVYEEEFGLVKGFCWSPDSKNLAFLKFNETEVSEYSLEYHYNELYPHNKRYKYPKAGEKNSTVSVYWYSVIYENSDLLISSEELENFEYIPRIYFSPTNKLIIQTMNRHQNEMNLISITTEKTYQTINGKQELVLNTEYSEFYTDKNNTYIDVIDNVFFLKDGNFMLLTSERSGYKHIYKVGIDGTISQLTEGNWDVIELYGTDEKNQFVYFSAAKQSAIDKGIYKVELKNKKTHILSSEYGYNEANFTTGMHYFIKKYSTANTPAVYILCNNSGKELSVLENNDKLKENAKTHEFAKKEFITFELYKRTLNGWMIRPNDFDSTKQYPVYLSIYGGPGSNTVTNSWDGSMAWHQLLAQNGYIVVSVDPRGTQYRGKTFKDATYLQLGKYELEDFIDVAQQLKKRPYIDSNRIGIQGWSYGGFMTSLAMTKGNGTFKMGIAVAPVTNWKYYDNIYTERFMRTPKENEKGYHDNSPIYFANKLKGKYLLIHGSTDDNVHFQNSIEMINALVNANKQFDFFMYPNRNHGIYGGNTRLHLYTMILNYVKYNL